MPPSQGSRPTDVGRRRVPPRLLFPTERADLRVSFRPEDDRFVLSLWHGDVCSGSAPLSARDAAEVASFLVTNLGERATWTPQVIDRDDPVTTAPPRARNRVMSGFERLQKRMFGR
jgi:hypothetical protein